jgi:hypothetical protein
VGLADTIEPLGESTVGFELLGLGGKLTIEQRHRDPNQNQRGVGGNRGKPCSSTSPQL